MFPPFKLMVKVMIDNQFLSFCLSISGEKHFCHKKIVEQMSQLIRGEGFPCPNYHGTYPDKPATPWQHGQKKCALCHCGNQFASPVRDEVLEHHQCL